jgi:hypothetical protein
MGPIRQDLLHPDLNVTGWRFDDEALACAEMKIEH